MLNPGQVPIDLKPIARLLRRPESISDHGHAATLRQRNFEHLANALDGASVFVVEALHFAAEHRRVRNHRGLHSRKIEIEPKLLRAIAFRFAIKPPNIFADEPKL